MTNLQRTPLYPLYANEPGVRCIDFGGWELPVQFSGIHKEHEAVREAAGLFDVSHMGEFIVEGPEAESLLQHMTVNDVSTLSIGQAQYSAMCYQDGGVVDDLLVYKLAEQRYMLVVNASNIEKDWAWLQQHVPVTGVKMSDESDHTALLAVQGPLAEAILSPLCDTKVAELTPFHFVQQVKLFGANTLISRTGYTGEDGFEIYLPSADAPAVWQGLLKHGESSGLLPAGLGARDTLRFEAKLPLYGQELSADISPLEGGIGFFVKLNKGDFIGSIALREQKDSGVPRKLIGIELIDRGIPRSHYPVYVGEKQVGEITTGTQSPTLKRNLGLALVDSAHAAIGTSLEVEIRGKRLQAEVVSVPFYKKARKGADSK